MNHIQLLDYLLFISESMMNQYEFLLPNIADVCMEVIIMYHRKAMATSVWCRSRCGNGLF